MINNILSRYEQSQKYMQGMMTNRVVMNDAVFAHWIENSSSFWYIRETKDGKEFRLVNAVAGTNTLAFNHEAMAKALTSSTGNEVSYLDLPITDVSFDFSPSRIRFQAFQKHWCYDIVNTQLQGVSFSDQHMLLSPDGNKAAFVRDHNLWVLDQTTGEETALTTDGTADYFYAEPVMPGKINRLHALWSYDSKHLLTVQVDLRNVIPLNSIHYCPEEIGKPPQLQQYKIARPGAEYVEECQLLSIDVTTGRIQRADYPPIPWSGYGYGFFNHRPMGWWSQDGRLTYFVDVNRGATVVKVVEFDTQTGNTRALFEERSDTFVKLCHTVLELPLFLPIPESNELIWFSERTGWGHLYLYDLTSGELKHPITEGEWLVREVLHYDHKRREVLIQTAARNKAVSPYYRDICKVNIDTGSMVTLVSGDYDYVVYQPHSFTVWARETLISDSAGTSGISPCGEYIVTTRSRVDLAPESLLIDRNAERTLTLENTDISGLPSNWHWPEPVKLKAADGQTDIYGVVYRPPGFSADKSYPVVDFSCGMRYSSFVPQGSFINGPCFDYSYMAGAALAALGFVVVALEGRGTPQREKAFQEHNYGSVESTSDFNDRIAGIRQLAKRYSYMDLNRVGITGSDNLANTVYGILNHPDFYKVAVLHCYVEPRDFWAAYGETYDGITPNKETISSACCAENRVESLSGKLLLIHGMLDSMGLPSTLRLVNALQKANKDFDLVCLPSIGHDIPSYALRRSWDYLVEHLQGISPPRNFELKTTIDMAMENLIESMETGCTMNQVLRTAG